MSTVSGTRLVKPDYYYPAVIHSTHEMDDKSASSGSTVGSGSGSNRLVKFVRDGLPGTPLLSRSGEDWLHPEYKKIIVFFNVIMFLCILAVFLATFPKLQKIEATVKSLEDSIGTTKLDHLRYELLFETLKGEIEMSNIPQNAALKELTERIEQLEKKNEDLRKEVDTLTIENVNLTEDLETLTIQADQQASQIAEQGLHINNQLIISDKLTERIDLLDKDVGALAIENINLTKGLETLTDQTDQQTSQIDEQGLHIDSLLGVSVTRASLECLNETRCYALCPAGTHVTGGGCYAQSGLVVDIPAPGQGWRCQTSLRTVIHSHVLCLPVFV